MLSFMNDNVIPYTTFRHYCNESGLKGLKEQRCLISEAEAAIKAYSQQVQANAAAQMEEASTSCMYLTPNEEKNLMQMIWFVCGQMSH